MALNMWIVKRWAGLFMASFIPTIAYACGVMFFNQFIAIPFFLGGAILGVVLGGFIISNPFSQMLEGKGLICINLDSTGVIRIFVAKLIQPFIKGKMDGQEVNDIYDRNAVCQLAQPVTAGTAIHKKTGGIHFDLTDEEFNSSRFGLWHYPCLIYNNQLKTFITKDMLATNEKQMFAEHMLLYLNRKIEELTSVIRDFGRYIVELTKPSSSIFANKWFWIVIVVGVVIMLLLFGKPIITQLLGKGSELAGSAISGATSAVVPR